MEGKRAMKQYGYGVDVGGTFIKFGLLDREGTLLDQWQIPTDASDEGTHLIPGVAGSLLAHMQSRGLTAADPVRHRAGRSVSGGSGRLGGRRRKHRLGPSAPGCRRRTADADGSHGQGGERRECGRPGRALEGRRTGAAAIW